jgi:drug/metabolite transporter (DMT)-like permease
VVSGQEAWEAARGQSTAGVAGLGLAVVAIIGLVLLMRPDPSVSVPAAGLLLALLAAVLHASYILLGRGGWGEVGDSTAALLIVATDAAGASEVNQRSAGDVGGPRR